MLDVPVRHHVPGLVAHDLVDLHRHAAVAVRGEGPRLDVPVDLGELAGPIISHPRGAPPAAPPPRPVALAAGGGGGGDPAAVRAVVAASARRRSRPPASPP